MPEAREPLLEKVLDDNIERLRQVPLFHSLHDAQLEALLDAAHVCVYPQDAAVVQQGQRIDEAQDGDSLYVILDGRVRVVRTVDGSERLLAELGPGEFFGEMSLLDGKPRSATVVAEDDSQCLVLPRWSLLRIVRRDPEVAINLLTVMSERLRNTLDMLV
jgi:CRP/FNR family cyclic AMP-dependent transcriptional regulator